jgi:hypothetical protein
MRPHEHLRVDLDELAEALDSRPREGGWLLDLKSGDLGYYSEEELSGDEAGSLDDPEQYMPIAPIDSFLSYQFMEDFIEDLPEGKPKLDLSATLERQKPHRAFKETLLAFPAVREAWFKYHDARMVEIAEEWLRDNFPEAVAVRKRNPDKS